MPGVTAPTTSAREFYRNQDQRITQIERAGNNNAEINAFCYLQLTGAQSIANNSETTITWNLEIEDEWGMHAAFATSITIPWAGLWLVHSEGRFTAITTTGTRRYMGIYINGGLRAINEFGPGGAPGFQITSPMRLAAADTVQVRLFQDSGGAVNWGGTAIWQSNFSVLYLQG